MYTSKLRNYNVAFNLQTELNCFIKNFDIYQFGLKSINEILKYFLFKFILVVFLYRFGIFCNLGQTMKYQNQWSISIVLMTKVT